MAQYAQPAIPEDSRSCSSGARKAEAKANKARHLAVQRVPVKRTLWTNPVLFAPKPGFMSSFGQGQAFTKVIGPF
ncbi:MAG TPA: hypothetical protein PKV33_04340 [Methanothrix sp.]|nr:hypothetical protein [Methanothrix sp.]